MKKILFHIPQLGSGGIEKLVRQWYPVAEEYDIKYVFTVIVTGGQAYDFFKEKGYTIYTVGKLGELGLKKYIDQFIKIIKEEDIQGVHVPASPMSSLILFAAWRAKCNMRIIHAHTNKYIRDDESEWSGWKLRLFRLVNNVMSNIKCTASESAAQYCYGKTKNVIYIYNGIDISKFKYNCNVRNNTRRQLNINEDCLVLGNVGRLTYQKNQEFVIYILREILNRGISAKAVLIGEGEDKNKLEKIVAENSLVDSVIFAGTTDEPNRYYCAMDAFVFPSRYEGLGIVAVEAQTSGVQCYVSTEVPEDAVISDRTLRIPLNIGPKGWADLILSNKNERKIDAWHDAEKSGFDETKTVRKMIGVYLGEKLDAFDDK